MRHLILGTVFLWSATIVNAGSIFQLSFDNTGSNVIDSISSNVVGSTNASYSTSVPPTGPSNGYSQQFDGTSTTTITGDFFFNSGHGNGTLSFWINAPDQPNTRSILWTRPDTDDFNRFNLVLSPGGAIGFDYRNSIGDLHSFITGNELLIPLNTWTKISISRIGNEYLFFRNDTLVYSAFDSSPDLPSTSAWTIAGRPIAGQNSPPNFVGLIDELSYTTDVPEPSTFALGAITAATVSAYRRRRRNGPPK